MTALMPIETRTLSARERATAAPVVAAVDGSSASRAAVEEAVALASELEAPLVFVYVRRNPARFLGSPFYQRRLTKELERARRALAVPLRMAEIADVEAEGEILEGSPGRRIVEFAHDRGAQLVVVGSRRNRLRRSVACAVVRAADRPVMVMGGETARLALARDG